MRELINSITLRPIESLFFLFVTAVAIGLLTTPHYTFAVLPGLAILILLFLGHKPHLGYYLIVFMIPFGAYRGFGGPYQYLTISKLVGFWLFLVIVSKSLLKKNPFNIQSNLWPWFLAFFLISFISALMSDYFSTSFNNLRQLLVSYLFFAMTLIFITEKRFLKTLPRILIISVSFTSFLSIIGYFFDIPLFAVNTDAESTKRAVGASRDPNMLSAMIIFIMPLLVYHLFSSRSSSERNLSILLLLVNVLAIMATYSRGGAMVLSAVMLLLFIEHMKRFKPKYLGFALGFASLALIMILVFVPASYWERLRSVTDSTSISIGRRYSYLVIGWEAFKDNPIFGSGPGTFREIYAGSDFARMFWTKGDTYRRYAHNSHIEIVTGTGILGFSIFISIIYLTLRNFQKAKKHARLCGLREMAMLVGAYRISFISLLIYFFLISSVYHKYLWLSFGLSQLALTLAQSKNKQPDGFVTHR